MLQSWGVILIRGFSSVQCVQFYRLKLGSMRSVEASDGLQCLEWEGGPGWWDGSNWNPKCQIVGNGTVWDGMSFLSFCFTLFDFPTAKKPFPLTSLTHRLPTFKHFKLRTAATSKIWGVAVVEDLFAKSLSCTHHGVAISLHVVISVVTPTVWAVRMLSEILRNPMKLAISSSR